MNNGKANPKVNQPTSFFENTEELSYGQIVLVSARWILVVVALILTLWDPAPISTLRVQLLVIFLVAAANFYLHAQALMQRPVPPPVIYAASAVDLAVVTLFVMINGGFNSPLFTFYFPAVVAFAVVFPTRITFIYTATTAVLYVLISMSSVSLPTSSSIDTSNDLLVLVARVVILAAIAVCGNVFLRIERGRREAATKAHADLVAEMTKRTANI
jgi:hypothetical protein